jgi:pantothenate kinase
MQNDEIDVGLMEIENWFVFRYEKMTRKEMDAQNRFFRKEADPWRYFVLEERGQNVPSSDF